jgi:hypothetical protein
MKLVVRVLVSYRRKTINKMKKIHEKAEAVNKKYFE